MNVSISKKALGLFMLFFSLNSAFSQSPDSFSIKNLHQVEPQYLSIKNGKLEYYRFGKGPPIVLIEGYATDVSSWNRQFLVTLAQQHNVIVFNNRNIGGSQIRSTRYESKDLAYDTYQLIQGLHLKKPTLLGISMGGMIAQQVAVLYPDQVSKLILINTVIAGNEARPPDPRIQKLMLHISLNNLERSVMVARLAIPPSWLLRMGWSLMRDRFQPMHYMEKRSLKTLLLQQQLVMHWMKDNETGKQIAQLRVPTLILNGGADVIIPPINSNILAQKIPHAVLIRFPEGGHAMIFQYPKEIARDVNEF
jgi:pimeloyl-ACP methyl ester carboxylesterase